MANIKKYANARECIEAQFKELGVTDESYCFYIFGDDGICVSNPIEGRDCEETTAKEMLEIAVERFNKYGNVSFQVKTPDGPIECVVCFPMHIIGKDDEETVNDKE